MNHGSTHGHFHLFVVIVVCCYCCWVASLVVVVAVRLYGGCMMDPLMDIFVCCCLYAVYLHVSTSQNPGDFSLYV